MPSARDRVWEVISNPKDVVSCIGGAELGAEHEDGSFDGTLAVKFGALRVRFGARVSLDLTPEEYEGRLSARGKDGQGATKFTAGATFRVLEGAEAGTSRVVVNGDIELSGKLAGLVEAGAGAVVSRMTREFSAALVARCAQPAVVGTPTSSAPSSAGAGPETASPEIAAPAPEPSGKEAVEKQGLWARIKAWFAGRKTKNTEGSR